MLYDCLSSSLVSCLSCGLVLLLPLSCTAVELVLAAATNPSSWMLFAWLLSLSVAVVCSAVEPGAWYACLPLHVVYMYDPIPGPWHDPAGAAEEELEQQQVR
jgi:hypothetical protein